MKTKFWCKQCFQRFCFQCIHPKTAAEALGWWLGYTRTHDVLSYCKISTISSASSRQPWFDLDPGCLQPPPPFVLAAAGRYPAEAPGPSALPEFIRVRASGGCERAGICLSLLQASTSWMVRWVLQHSKSPFRETHKLSLTALQQKVFWPG